MKRKLTKMTLEMAPPSAGRVDVRDTDSPLVLRVTSNGARSLSIRSRINGEQVRLTYLGAVTIDNLSSARKWAHDAVTKCAQGVDPREEERQLREAEELEAARAKASSVAAVAAEFLKLHAKKLRTYDEIKAYVDRYVLPRWKEKTIYDVRRGDVVRLLDEIAAGEFIDAAGEKWGGPHAADHVLAILRKLFNWYAIRDEHFTSPIVTGMAKTKPKEHARARILSDDEIRAMWLSLEGTGTFGAIVKALLLTGQRREEVAGMSWKEVDSDGVWTIPAERYKTNRAHHVPLSEVVRELIAAQDAINDSDLVFTTTGKTAFSGFSKSKARLDAAMLTYMQKRAIKSGKDASKVELTDWRIHDLRRTARSLMSRAGVRPDIAERVLGHVIPGVEGVYDRHSYADEKKDALAKLAKMVAGIVNPPSAGNVVNMPHREAAHA